jgi:hypothetical protein
MDRDSPFQVAPELADMLQSFMDSVHNEINQLRRVIYDLHTRERYSEARKATMSDEEIERRKRLIAKLLGLDPRALAEEEET